MPKLKGTLLVKVASLFIVLGGVLDIFLVISEIAKGTQFDTSLTINAAIAVVLGLIYIVIGIFALRRAENPDAWKAIVIRGVILIALDLIDCVYSLIMGSANSQLLFILAMPIIMILGAIFNKQDAEKQRKRELEEKNKSKNKNMTKKKKSPKRPTKKAPIHKK